MDTFQGINISHLGKFGKSSTQNAIFGRYVSSLEGIFSNSQLGWVLMDRVEVDHVFFSGSFIIGEVHLLSLLSVNQELWGSDREGTFPKSVYHVCWCWVWRVDNDRSLFLPTTGWWKTRCIVKSHKSKSNMIYILNQRHTTMSTNTTHIEFCI